ncbi:MAG TPA: cysteine--tRNA ligase [Anaerolineales bacterium]|nr:cysteine--tRNA ligase [Anaerolineales bacterium]
MTLQIYNTLTRRKETLETLEPGQVRMYVCGPTVYAKAHVGHAMSSVVFDVIHRYLEYRGYRVIHVMNYTDVEDKIIQRARELGEPPDQLATRHRLEYEELLQRLNILIPSVRPQASLEMPAILSMIEGLIAKGAAYAVDGDVYFRVARDPDYGRLSGRKLEDMRAGTRLAVDERKEDPADFALWKAAKEGEPQWPSPWGPGRPGWHIECSAMNLRYLGEQIDIHGGGNDLVFPHHENEIAQTETVTGKPFARYWVHNGMLQLGGEKMSKSLGNLVTVEDFLRHHEADAFRLLVLNSGYRNPLTYTDDVVAQAERALERLRGALKPGAPAGGEVPGLAEQAAAARRGFESAMDDDFNTAGGLSHIFELVRAVNQARDQGASTAALQPAQDELRKLAGILGLRLEARRLDDNQVGPLVDLLIEIRKDLRQARQWELADRIRDRLAEQGIALEDGKDGTRWSIG